MKDSSNDPRRREKLYRVPSVSLMNVYYHFKGPVQPAAPPSPLEKQRLTVALA